MKSWSILWLLVAGASTVDKRSLQKFTEILRELNETIKKDQAPISKFAIFPKDAKVIYNSFQNCIAYFETRDSKTRRHFARAACARSFYFSVFRHESFSVDTFYSEACFFMYNSSSKGGARPQNIHERDNHLNNFIIEALAEHSPPTTLFISKTPPQRTVKAVQCVISLVSFIIPDKYTPITHPEPFSLGDFILERNKYFLALTSQAVTALNNDPTSSSLYFDPPSFLFRLVSRALLLGSFSTDLEATSCERLPTLSTFLHSYPFLSSSPLLATFDAYLEKANEVFSTFSPYEDPHWQSLLPQATREIGSLTTVDADFFKTYHYHPCVEIRKKQRQRIDDCVLGLLASCTSFEPVLNPHFPKRYQDSLVNFSSALGLSLLPSSYFTFEPLDSSIFGSLDTFITKGIQEPVRDSNMDSSISLGRTIIHGEGDRVFSIIAYFFNTFIQKSPTFLVDRVFELPSAFLKDAAMKDASPALKSFIFHFLTRLSFILQMHSLHYQSEVSSEYLSKVINVSYGERAMHYFNSLCGAFEGWATPLEEDIVPDEISHERDVGSVANPDGNPRFIVKNSGNRLPSISSPLLSIPLNPSPRKEYIKKPSVYRPEDEELNIVLLAKMMHKRYSEILASSVTSSSTPVAAYSPFLMSLMNSVSTYLTPEEIALVFPYLMTITSVKGLEDFGSFLNLYMVEYAAYWSCPDAKIVESTMKKRVQTFSNLPELEKGLFSRCKIAELFREDFFNRLVGLMENKEGMLLTSLPVLAKRWAMDKINSEADKERLNNQKKFAEKESSGEKWKVRGELERFLVRRAVENTFFLHYPTDAPPHESSNKKVILGRVLWFLEQQANDSPCQKIGEWVSGREFESTTGNWNSKHVEDRRDPFPSCDYSIPINHQRDHKDMRQKKYQEDGRRADSPVAGKSKYILEVKSGFTAGARSDYPIGGGSGILSGEQSEFSKGGRGMLSRGEVTQARKTKFAAERTAEEAVLAKIMKTVPETIYKVFSKSLTRENVLYKIPTLLLTGRYTDAKISLPSAVSSFDITHAVEHRSILSLNAKNILDVFSDFLFPSLPPTPPRQPSHLAIPPSLSISGVFPNPSPVIEVPLSLSSIDKGDPFSRNSVPVSATHLPLLPLLTISPSPPRESNGKHALAKLKEDFIFLITEKETIQEQRNFSPSSRAPQKIKINNKSLENAVGESHLKNILAARNEYYDALMSIHGIVQEHLHYELSQCVAKNVFQGDHFPSFRNMRHKVALHGLSDPFIPSSKNINESGQFSTVLMDWERRDLGDEGNIFQERAETTIMKQEREAREKEISFEKKINENIKNIIHQQQNNKNKFSPNHRPPKEIYEIEEDEYENSMFKCAGEVKRTIPKFVKIQTERTVIQKYAFSLAKALGDWDNVLRNLHKAKREIESYVISTLTEKTFIYLLLETIGASYFSTGYLGRIELLVEEAVLSENMEHFALPETREFLTKLSEAYWLARTEQYTWNKQKDEEEKKKDIARREYGNAVSPRINSIQALGPARLLEEFRTYLEKKWRKREPAEGQVFDWSIRKGSPIDASLVVNYVEDETLGMPVKLSPLKVEREKAMIFDESFSNIGRESPIKKRSRSLRKPSSILPKGHDITEGNRDYEDFSIENEFKIKPMKTRESHPSPIKERLSTFYDLLILLRHTQLKLINSHHKADEIKMMRYAEELVSTILNEVHNTIISRIPIPSEEHYLYSDVDYPVDHPLLMSVRSFAKYLTSSEYRESLLQKSRLGIRERNIEFAKHYFDVKGALRGEDTGLLYYDRHRIDVDLVKKDALLLEEKRDLDSHSRINIEADQGAYMRFLNKVVAEENPISEHLIKNIKK